MARGSSFWHLAVPRNTRKKCREERNAVREGVRRLPGGMMNPTREEEEEEEEGGRKTTRGELFGYRGEG